jgi:hypothetical protein
VLTATLISKTARLLRAGRRCLSRQDGNHVDGSAARYVRAVAQMAKVLALRGKSGRREAPGKFGAWRAGLAEMASRF